LFWNYRFKKIHLLFKLFSALEIIISITFYTYVFLMLLKRFNTSQLKSLRLTFAFFLWLLVAFSSYFLISVYLHNGGNSISYGSDSTAIENVYKEYATNGINSIGYLSLKYDHKAFFLLINGPIFQFFGVSNLIFLILILCNYLLFLATSVTILSIVVLRPDGTMRTLSPVRILPELIRPLKPRKSKLGRFTHCTGIRNGFSPAAFASTSTVSKC
jgi:hypothetical protein